MKTIELATGMTAAYREAGEGEPIILLHGYCGSGEYWNGVIGPISAYGRVIAPDFRGHGGSSAGEGTYGMEMLADDVAALMDALKLERAHLFGHSLGGYVALAFAERHPERLLSFSLVHSTAYPDADAAKANRLKAAETIAAEGVRPFVEGLVPKLFAPGHRDSRSAQLLEAIEIGYGTSAEGAIGCALGMRERPDRVLTLAETQVPVLLLAGELDEVIPAERRFPAAGDRISAVTLAGVGHMGMKEAPERFSEEIVAFLERVRGTASV
ncbi:alpha/beta fold hydrolase [Cohnella suwonensis]|uniref:Alpha/beta fold hydrolase n=1 Tax=Cohnella suwonensis TaxID=696072 RepID=A0ABW0LTI1_9BACL